MENLFPPVNGPLSTFVNKKTFTSPGQYQSIQVIEPRDISALKERGWTDKDAQPTPGLCTIR